MATAAFTEGDQLLWETRERGALVERRVRYEGVERGEHIVRFGPRLHTVPADELHPLPPPPAPPVILTPPQPPPPEPIETRRVALHRAQLQWQESTAAAQAADALLLKAEKAVAAARYELTDRFGHLEEKAANIALARVMNGHDDPPIDDIEPQAWANREAARQRLTATQTARDRLMSEAARCWEQARQADIRHKSAAKHVLAALIEAAIAELAETENQAATRRAEALALSQLWIAGGPVVLHDAAISAVANPPPVIIDPIGLQRQCIETRQQPWLHTYDRLLADPAAEFEPAVPA